MNNLKLLFSPTLLLLLAYSFTLVILSSCGNEEDEEEIVMDDSEPVPLTVVNYKGEWNGNLGFSNVSISTTIDTVGTNSFQGPFFISSSFTPCCGVNNDGTISFQVDGDQIVNFRYSDTIPNCEGTFLGSGSIQSNGNLEIDITGTDCDGNHIATLSLSRN